MYSGCKSSKPHNREALHNIVSLKWQTRSESFIYLFIYLLVYVKYMLNMNVFRCIPDYECQKLYVVGEHKFL